MFVQQSSPIFYFFIFYFDEKSSPIFRYNKIKECLMCQNHGLKNWEISPIFWRNIGYWRWPKSATYYQLKEKLPKNLQNIVDILVIGWFFSENIERDSTRAWAREDKQKKSKKINDFLKNHLFISDKLLINCQIFNNLFSKRPIFLKKTSIHIFLNEFFFQFIFYFKFITLLFNIIILFLINFHIISLILF